MHLISKAISLKPTVAVYHRNLGAAYYNLKQYDQVIKQHQLAIGLEPENATNYHNLGSAYFRTKQYLKAVEEFDLAILKNPKQDLSYSWRGDCFKEMGQLDLALQCYQKAY